MLKRTILTRLFPNQSRLERYREAWRHCGLKYFGCDYDDPRYVHRRDSYVRIHKRYGKELDKHLPF